MSRAERRGVGVREEDLDRLVYLLVEIDEVAFGQEAPVAHENLGEAVDIASELGLDPGGGFEPQPHC